MENRSDNATTFPCAQNEHTGQMSAYRLAVCLATIGWSGDELARRAEKHRTTVRRWLDGSGRIDPAIGQWIEQLAAAHRALPRPGSRAASEGSILTSGRV